MILLRQRLWRTDGEDAGGRCQQPEPETYHSKIEGRLAGDPAEQDRAHTHTGVEEFEQGGAVFAAGLSPAGLDRIDMIFWSAENLFSAFYTPFNAPFLRPLTSYL